MDYVITKKGQVQVAIKDQLLLYIRVEDSVEKNCVVQALELEFIFLGRQFKLVISIPTSCIINEIGRSTIYTALRINTKAEKSFIAKANTF